MFKLTKFTGEEFYINPDMIKCIEACGDTVVTFITGERLLVRERPEEICRRYIAYKKEVGTRLPCIERSVYAEAGS